MKLTTKKASAILLAGLLSTTTLGWQPSAPTALAAANQHQQGQLPPAAENTLQTLYTLKPELRNMQKKTTAPISGVYQLRFDKRIAADKIELYAFVELDAVTGALRSYSNEEEVEKGGNPTEAIAKQKAGGFLQKVLGADFNKYKASQTSKGAWDAITYTRYENGLPVFSDYYVVGVNQGEVTYVNTADGAPLRTSAKLFTKAGKVLSNDAVTKKAASLMELSYYAADRKTSKPALQYSLASTGYLNAMTGEEVVAASSHKSRYSDVIAVKAGGKKFTATNPAEVERVLKEEYHVNLDGISLKTDEQTPPEMKGEQETIYRSKEGKGKITVYTNNGVVTGFQIRRTTETIGASQHNNTPANAQLTYSQAQEKALQFLQPFLDEGVKELKIDYNSIMMPSATAYSFSFFVLHDGVIVRDQKYLVNVDGQTGEIVNFMDYFTRPSSPFPDKKKAVSKEVAAIQFLKEHKAVLGYTFPVQNGKQQQKPVLVYKVDTTSSFMLDAVTGKAIK